MSFCVGNIKEKSNDEILWKKLISPGIQFPDPYEPLPKNVMVLYNKEPIKLRTDITNDHHFNISEEEGAVFFAKIIDSENTAKAAGKKNKIYSTDKTFRNNFWNDWKKILGPGHKIKDFDKVDFTPIANYIARNREEKKAKRKNMSKEAKQEEKEEKNALKERFGYAIVDDVKRAISPWIVEPPGIFISRSQYCGKIRSRIKPEDITINSTNKPECFVQKSSIKNPNPKPCKWCKYVTIPTAAWLASWKHTILPTGIKYMRFVFDEKKDIEKFDKARLLKQNIEKIRERYTDDMNNKKSETRLEGLVVYLLDKLAIRIGTNKSSNKSSKTDEDEDEDENEDAEEDYEESKNEETKDEESKDEDEDEETQGLTTLENRNITLHENSKLQVQFIGKSGIPYDNTIEIEQIAYFLIGKLLQRTKPNERIFLGITDSKVNKYLKTITPDTGITAKTFRTFHACATLQEQLKKQITDTNLKVASSIAEKLQVFKQANMMTGLLLNHKRLVDSSVKIGDIEKKIEEAKNKLRENLTEIQKNKLQTQIKRWESDHMICKNQVNLATSKQNYADPRIFIAFAKKIELPIEKIYTKAQLIKFKWAMETDENFNF